MQLPQPPEDRRSTAGHTAPEADVQHPLPLEDQRSSTGHTAPEEDLQHPPRSTTGTGKYARHTQTHLKPSKGQNRETYQHHKQDLFIQRDKKTPYIYITTNTYLQLAKMVADNSPNPKDCYVCGFIPHSTTDGLPFMALPITSCDTCHILHFNSTYEHCACPNPPQIRQLSCHQTHTNCYSCNTPDPLTLAMVPKTFKWCVEGTGTIHLGLSNCDTIYISTEQLPEKPKQQLSFDPIDDYNHLAALTTHCSIPLPKGVYWICGMKAYEVLPVGWSGRCGLGHVIPAMRVLTTPPEVRIVKRDLYTHTQTPWTRFFGALVPSYGVMAALDQIRDLSHAVEDLANTTANGMSMLSQEMTAVRMMTLQNRAALDYLLASQGGTCAVIGTECCTFIPDHNATIQEITNHLNNIAKTLHNPVTTGLFNWFKEKLGAFGYVIFEFGLLGLGILTVIRPLVTCLKSICNSILSKTTKIMYTTTTQPTLPMETLDEENPDFLFKKCGLKKNTH